MNAYDAEAQLKTRQRHVYTAPLHQPAADQIPLQFDPPQPAEPELTIEARFRQFHAANPHIYQALRELALAQARAGVRQIRSKWLFEQLRAAGTAAESRDEYRLNNIYTSRYARLLDADPELHGLIPQRRLLAE